MCAVLAADVLAIVALPVSIGAAILKYRLYDIDRIISRTLAYAIVTGLLIGVYAGLVLLATQVLSFHTPVAVAASTLAAVALFSPLRRRVQRVVDRRFNRARYDADQTIAAFAARLKDNVDLAAVRDDLAGVVSDALEPAPVSASAARADWSEHPGGDLEDRGYGLAGLLSPPLAAQGLTGAPATYALFENARRARLGQSRGGYALGLGRLFAPFTRVAAGNPHASAPVERTAIELITPTAANRVIADPYTRYLVAREKVNQGAAVLLMPVAMARRLGVPEARWVFLPGHADLRERDLLDRPDLSRAPALAAAAGHGWRWRGSGRARWPRSTCTPASPSRSRSLPTASAWRPAIPAA